MMYEILSNSRMRILGKTVKYYNRHLFLGVVFLKYQKKASVYDSLT